MNFELRNMVIARSRDSNSRLPNRSLDLGNIITPELALLSPNRNEITPRGSSRELALAVYSERLRKSYIQNENGFRDGMVKLGETFRQGQAISIVCFCRAGQMCHADVVKLAIEKVGKALEIRDRGEKPKIGQSPETNFRLSNPRTEKAVNEILSFTRIDSELLKLNDTNGRNRSEQASYLNTKSQFLRDTYERGGVVQDGHLIVPSDQQKLASPINLSTYQYGVQRLDSLLGPVKSREAVPQIIELGRTIAGAHADRETETKVFQWMYEAFEGKRELLDQQVIVDAKDETKIERFERVLVEVENLASEMKVLEPSDQFVQHEALYEKSESEQELEADNEIDDLVEHLDEAPDYAQQTKSFERIELDDSPLSLIASEMSVGEIEDWAKVKFPALDEALENGIKPSVILKLFKAKPGLEAKSTEGKQMAYDELPFANAYMEHQLNQPETRLRHFNKRYRDFAQRLDRCRTRDEVIEVSSSIRRENSEANKILASAGKTENTQTLKPLTTREIQLLFTEQSPRHYTSEMTVAKLDYSVVGQDKIAKTRALKNGEITATLEAQMLIKSLAERMERPYIEDSLSATKHFLTSLQTPNQELRLKNRFDHGEIYQKLAPAERDYVFQMAMEQKDRLKDTLEKVTQHSATVLPQHCDSLSSDLKVTELQSSLTKELVALSLAEADQLTVKARTTELLGDHLDKFGSNTVDDRKLSMLSLELSEIVVGIERAETKTNSRISPAIENQLKGVDRGNQYDLDLSR